MHGMRGGGRNEARINARPSDRHISICKNYSAAERCNSVYKSAIDEMAATKHTPAQQHANNPVRAKSACKLNRDHLADESFKHWSEDNSEEEESALAEVGEVTCGGFPPILSRY